MFFGRKVMITFHRVPIPRSEETNTVHMFPSNIQKLIDVFSVFFGLKKMGCQEIKLENVLYDNPGCKTNPLPGSCPARDHQV